MLGGTATVRCLLSRSEQYPDTVRDPASTYVSSGRPW